jgi:predicted transcriptional regulator of viral defense system
MIRHMMLTTKSAREAQDTVHILQEHLRWVDARVEPRTLLDRVLRRYRVTVARFDIGGAQY